ncbi:MAG: hypothetical protein LBQ43_00945 [Holosporales bacterium]|nr:hypothetical protein [Holosporales bacterium]
MQKIKLFKIVLISMCFSSAFFGMKKYPGVPNSYGSRLEGSQIFARSKGRQFSETWSYACGPSERGPKNEDSHALIGLTDSKSFGNWRYFKEIQDQTYGSFNKTVSNNVIFSLLLSSVKEKANDIIEGQGGRYAAMLVLMKCFDDPNFTPLRDTLREIAMYIMLNSKPETINPDNFGLENINTFVAKMFPADIVADRLDNYVKYLELEVPEPSQIYIDALRQPDDEEIIKIAVDRAWRRINNFDLNELEMDIDNERFAEMREKEAHTLYQKRAIIASEQAIIACDQKRAKILSDRIKSGSPIKDYDQFERSALSILKAFSASLLKSQSSNKDMLRLFNEQIQRAKELPDIGAIQINDERMASACTPVIRLANLFFDAEYCNCFIDKVGIKVGTGFFNYLKKTELLDFLANDRESFEFVTLSDQTRVIFPLRLDLCGKYHKSHLYSVWMPIKSRQSCEYFAWKPHVSVYPSAATRMLRYISPHLMLGSDYFPFKLNPTLWKMRDLYLGSLYLCWSETHPGITQFGKWFTCYPQDQTEFVETVHSLKRATGYAIARGDIKPERDIVPLVGDARVGEKGAVFIRDETCYRYYPNCGNIPLAVSGVGDLFFHGKSYKIGLDADGKFPRPSAGDQTPDEIFVEIYYLTQEKGKEYSPQEWVRFKERFNNYREKRGLIKKRNF